jgi:hypothetical protein
MLNVAGSPAEKPIVGEEKPLLAWITWFSQVRDIMSAVTMSGTTAQRPTGFLWIGRPFWDETLQKPVYLSAIGADGAPNVWKDASGSTV